MSEKVYCEDCEKYNSRPQGPTRWHSLAYCNVEEDDYYSKKHLKTRSPEVLNANNNCPHFIKKEA